MILNWDLKMFWLYIFSVNMKGIRSSQLSTWLLIAENISSLKIQSLWQLWKAFQCDAKCITDHKDLSIRKDRSLFYHQMWYRICYTAFFWKFEMIVDLGRGTTREREGLPRFWKKWPCLWPTKHQCWTYCGFV